MTDVNPRILDLILNEALVITSTRRDKFLLRFSWMLGNDSMGTNLLLSDQAPDVGRTLAANYEIEAGLRVFDDKLDAIADAQKSSTCREKIAFLDAHFSYWRSGIARAERKLRCYACKCNKTCDCACGKTACLEHSHNFIIDRNCGSLKPILDRECLACHDLRKSAEKNSGRILH